MAGTFTYDLTLPTARDYARFRLDDLVANAPYIADETYDVLISRYGEVEGLALAAGQIAIQVSKKVTAFGVAAGIRFTKANLDYYQELPDIIRGEPPFSTNIGTVKRRLARVGKLTTHMSARDCGIYVVTRSVC